MTELKKHDECNEQITTIQQFLYDLHNDWHLRLCEFDEHEGNWYPTILNIDQLIFKYFDIDIIKLDEERRELIKSFRQKQEISVPQTIPSPPLDPPNAELLEALRRPISKETPIIIETTHLTIQQLREQRRQMKRQINAPKKK